MSDPLNDIPTRDEFEDEEKELAKCGLQFELNRRRFLQTAGAISALAATGFPSALFAELAEQTGVAVPNQTVALKINGKTESLLLDPRLSLLDVLRESLDLTGTKKGCDHGQCGACTVLIDGRRVNSCLTLAVAAEGAEITTIEGLAKSLDPKDASDLHPMQARATFPRRSKRWRLQSAYRPIPQHCISNLGGFTGGRS